jgi:hypothetical protein
MVTLISYQSSGGDQGRCDAKCYDAREDECTCICASRNHGAGLEQAIDNTRELAESWIEDGRAQGHTGFELATEVTHEPLFDMEVGG